MARRAVNRELQAQVRWDWKPDDVRELVEEILDDWCDEDGGEAEDFEDDLQDADEED